jgi:hypothetical protein
MIQKLNALVGQYIRVASRYYDDGDRLNFQLYGKLEAPVDDDALFYLRVKDCVSGCSGVSFKVTDVLEINKRIYDHEIILR